MTNATTGGPQPRSNGSASVRPAARFWRATGCAGFIVLAWWQIAHHAMWRDELQAWEIAVASRWPWDIYRNLRYEGHPALWYLVLWVGGSISTDPRAMQVCQGLVAAGLVGCVWLLMPFRPIEKFLISLSYFLLFEYAVMSRSYGLGVLLTLLAMACWQCRTPSVGFARRLAPWLLLGLAANVSLYNALLAVVLAGWRLWTSRGDRRIPVAEIGLFGLLLAVSALTISQAADASPAPLLSANWSEQRVIGSVIQIMRTFLPVGSDPGRFWEPYPFQGIWAYWLTTLPMLWLLARAVGNERPAVYPIVAVAGGTALINLAVYPAAIRHTGMIFIAFLLMAWHARSRGRLNPRSFALVLAFNALGGLVALHGAAERPFSQAAAAAGWFPENGLQEAFVASANGPIGNAIAGYLRRPIYYMDCACLGTYVSWRRDAEMDRRAARPLEDRLAQLMDERQLDRLYFITVKGAGKPVGNAADGLTVRPVASFDGATDTDENYDIFRIDRVRPRS